MQFLRKKFKNNLHTTSIYFYIKFRLNLLSFCCEVVKLFSFASLEILWRQIDFKSTSNSNWRILCVICTLSTRRIITWKHLLPTSWVSGNHDDGTSFSANAMTVSFFSNEEHRYVAVARIWVKSSDWQGPVLAKDRVESQWTDPVWLPGNSQITTWVCQKIARTFRRYAVISWRRRIETNKVNLYLDIRINIKGEIKLSRTKVQFQFKICKRKKIPPRIKQKALHVFFSALLKSSPIRSFQTFNTDSSWYSGRNTKYKIASALFSPEFYSEGEDCSSSNEVPHRAKDTSGRIYGTRGVQNAERQRESRRRRRRNTKKDGKENAKSENER